MWIIESYLLDSNDFYPLIAMGTTATEYHIMILSTSSNYIISSISFETSIPNPKSDLLLSLEGHTKAHKLLSNSEEVLIFSRYTYF